MISGPFYSAGLKCSFHFKYSLSKYAYENIGTWYTNNAANDTLNRMSKTQETLSVNIKSRDSGNRQKYRLYFG